jgi:hypothetical protein
MLMQLITGITLLVISVFLLIMAGQMKKHEKNRK